MSSGCHLINEESVTKVAPNPNISRLFRQRCIEYSKYAQMGGVEISPYFENSGERFKMLPFAFQKAILDNLEGSVEICASAIENGIDIRESSLPLVWWSLRKFGLRPPSDLFAQLSDEDLIEVYDINQRQIFRSFNLFRCISYSLEELFSYEWWELFERQVDVNKRLLEITESLLKEGSSIIHVDMPPHFVEEKFSCRRTVHQIQTRLGAPLYFQGDQQIAGFLCCSRLVKFVDDGWTKPHSGQPI